MSDSHADTSVPRAALLGAAAVVAVALILASAARITGIGRTPNPVSEPVERIALHFEDRADGAVLVRRADGGEMLEVLEPGAHGFVRSVLRGLARERRARSLGPEEPFLLTRWADGRLSLSDPATGRQVELDAFGPDNTAAFAQLLTAAQRS